MKSVYSITIGKDSNFCKEEIFLKKANAHLRAF
jgi:hypothetical protein